MDDLSGLLPDHKIGFFPANESAFYDVAAASDELSNQRLQVLLDLLHSKMQGVVTTAEALMLPVMPPEIVASQIKTLRWVTDLIFRNG
jgi:transcription-repair coupling factor (superfamily II helicase)